MESLIAMSVALIMASQSPNVPPALRIQALEVASIALQYAQSNQSNPELPNVTVNTPHEKTAAEKQCDDPTVKSSPVCQRGGYSI